MSCCYFRRHVDVLCTFLINYNLSGLHTFCRSLNKLVCTRRRLGNCWRL